MAFPETLDPTSPADLDSPRQGAAQIRALKQLIADVFGLPVSPNSITGAAFQITAAGLVSLAQGTGGILLTNSSGGTLVAGDVVAINTAADKSVVLQDALGSLFPYVVSLGTLATGTVGSFFASGLIPSVKTAGAVTRGHYIQKSATAKAVEDTGTAIASGVAPPTGALGVALTGVGGAGSISALWFGIPVGGGSGSGTLPGARAFNGAGQSLAGGTSTVLTFTGTRFNRSAVWDVGNPTRFTAPSTGIYTIGAHMVIAQNCGLWVRRNGTTQISTYGSAERAPTPSHCFVNTVYLLNSSDYVQIMGINFDAGAHTTIVAGNYSVEAWCQMVSS